MSAVFVLADVGAVAAFAVVVLAALIIGIRRGDRHHLADEPRSASDAFARRLNEVIAAIARWFGGGR
jgi:hypothetical protein